MLRVDGDLGVIEVGRSISFICDCRKSYLRSARCPKRRAAFLVRTRCHSLIEQVERQTRGDGAINLLFTRMSVKQPTAISSIFCQNKFFGADQRTFSQITRHRSDYKISLLLARFRFNVSKLTKNLYLSGACALRADTFEKLGITCVVNCTTREELPDPPLPDRVTTYLRIPVPDSTATDLYPYFHQTSDTIRKVSSCAYLLGTLWPKRGLRNQGGERNT